MSNRDEMTKTELHDEIMAVVAQIDGVPERFELNAKGNLAEIDSRVLMLAASVVHRLMLWEKHPDTSPDSYLV